jgi:sodium transport system permease protein
MKFQHLLHVFRKDSLEILRDRRTLFVNIVLPALLYPFIALFMLQVVQLTKGQQSDPPRVALIDIPERLHELLAVPVDKANDVQDDPQRAITPVIIVELPHRTMINLRSAALELAHAENDLNEKIADELQALTIKRQVLLELLRESRLAGLLLNQPDLSSTQTRWYATYDNAHVKGERVKRAIGQAAEKYRNEKILERLSLAGLGKDALQPLSLVSQPLAPFAESVRTNLAGIIPLILVVFAALGAFYPAIDLIAGERERGTLESLLSWPVRRRDLFLGKLLVTCVAALISVILNLTSLALTMGLVGNQLASSGTDLGGAIGTGLGTLALCVAVLLPLTLTMGALSLALAGIAASAKEAQNYLSPLLLVVLVAAMVAAIPDTQPSFILDLIPITGSVLALKESLQGHSIPWFHLLVSTGASIALATVVVAWATRLLDDERFCYPGLVRAGWGRFRHWGKPPETPNGLEVMAVFGVVVGGMTMGASLFQGMPVIVMIATPLLLFVLFPALLHCWLGGYTPQTVLGMRPAPWNGVARGIAAIPFAILLSMAIGSLQPQPTDSDTHMLEKMIGELRAHGIFIELICLALIPAVCEEIFCRGTLLSGLTRGTGAIGGVMVSSFLFAALHLSPYRFLPQMSLGIVLALLALRYRSIIPCIILHAGHNAGVLLIDHTGTTTMLESVPPLAALGIGFLGLWFLIIMPQRKALDRKDPGLGERIL